MATIEPQTKSTNSESETNPTQSNSTSSTSPLPASITNSTNAQALGQPITTSTSNPDQIGTASTSTTSPPTQPARIAKPAAEAPNVTVTPASPTQDINTSASTSHPSVVPTTAQPITEAASSVVSEGKMKDKEKGPTDSETALMSDPTIMSEKEKVEHSAGDSTTGGGAKSSPIQTLTRKLSGKSATNTPSPAPQTTTTTTTSPNAGTATANPTTSPSASTSKPPQSTSTAANPAQTISVSRSTTTPARQTAQKKKRKRGGFAGFLLALGCLSASDFEDDPSTKKASSSAPVTNEKAAMREGDRTAAAGAAAGTAGKTVAQDPTAKTTTNTNTTLVGDNDKTATPVKNADVVVAPSTSTPVPADETAGLTSAAVQAPGSGSELLPTPRKSSSSRDMGVDPNVSQAQGTSTGSAVDNTKTETSGGYSDISSSDIRSGDETGQGDDQGDEYPMDEEYEDEEDRLIAQGGMGIPLDENGNPAPLLPSMDKIHHGRKCLVLDLDETLLHSSFKMLPNADYIVPVEIETQTHNVYVIKRPGVDHFLREMGKLYEVVVFTASLPKYADPVLDILDVEGVVRHRLFRDSCYNHKGNYVKDLSQLGRDIHETIIIDNSPASYIFHPTNAVPVSTWFNDPHDTELTDLCPFLADLSTVSDVRGVLDGTI